jgi:hypothetical protein
VPDHFAGAVSAWDIEQHLLVSDAPKYSQVLLEGIADRPNVCIVRMNFDWQSDQLAVSASHVTISRKQ